MRRAAAAVIAGLTLGAAPATLAHNGPRIWIGVDESNGNRLVTYGDPATAPVSARPEGDAGDIAQHVAGVQPLRTFGIHGDSAEEGGNLFVTEAPGFTAVSTTEFNEGDQFNIRFLGGLKVWDGSAFVPSPVADWEFEYRNPGTNQLESFEVPDDPMPSPVHFWNLSNAGTSRPHNHPTHYLLGDGENTVPGPDGLYLLTAELSATSTSKTYQTSLPLGILWQVNAWAENDPGQPAPYPHALSDFAAAWNASPVAEPWRVADVNGDGQVSVADVGVLATHFGQTLAGGRTVGDLNDDGSVTVADVGILATYFGQPGPAASGSFNSTLAQYPTLASAVPEPTPAVMLAFAVFVPATWRRRRRGCRVTGQPLVVLPPRSIDNLLPVFRRMEMPMHPRNPSKSGTVRLCDFRRCGGGRRNLGRA